ncbi:apolipoprotein N-acyltransferase [Labrenzia sp. OB1]|uniref:apolipoprotein N-acyltransferase n=1 Tax=Labrenzia sp. OB1 TaxID=1561204 RepID=UPI0007B214A9|nr:apolipoprotein N-acyltransferase [Labrenzia sp. OB1]KZM50820.1 acyltransferase [Labrenzia sp. OB1]
MHWLSQRLAVLPNFFLLSWGWQRRMVCVLCGAATAFALPPYGLIPVLAITFPCLVWILDGAVEPGPGKVRSRLRTGFVLGWLFGFGYFLSGLWWIGAAFLVEAERFAWLMPFAVLAMPVGLALFTGLGVALAALLWSDRFYRIVLLAACLSLSDWLRGHVLTGFPWNAFGYGVSGSLTLSQTASLVGIYGLTFLTLALAASPAVLADARPLRQRLAALGAAITVLVVVAVYGAVRIASVETQDAALDIRIVQPSISQKDKWRPEFRDTIFQTYLDMTEAPLGGTARVGMPRLVVWPESAVPFLLTQEPDALYRVAGALGEASELVTGAIRAEAGAEGAVYFNSVYLIGDDGTVRGIYDKVRLVPFGEFVPLRSVLDGLGISNLAGPLEGFEAGFQRRELSTAGGLGFLPLICYEAIFPVDLPGKTGAPAFLLNVTNDAWFGRTPGPYQHFAQARMRAIETGLPLIRAANTGISAIVDGTGEVIDALSVFEKGVIDGRLPQSIGKTIYGRFGDATFLIVAILLVLFAGAFIYNRRSRVN